ncbi:phospholipase D family protein [Rubinisphaera sp. JC750]|uniref:phospholipase D family protein n=1 Tax=Rubinisphaera sp. JC750 TaxID=2898658 RepID=UPI001F3990B9|nr:phospholipase D family protein [Rubinisphaera sp. JC750]
MKFLRRSKDTEAELKRLIQHCKSLRWSVAWASHGFPLLDHLVKHTAKIHQLTIGIHFYQTHPDFIAAFMGHDDVRFVMNPSGVFHPKLYYFDLGDGNWECITGSPNFTHSAFHANTEHACLFSNIDVGAESNHREILLALDEAMVSGKTLSDKELAAYRSIWKRQQKRLGPLSGSYTPPEKKKGKRSPLDVPLFVEDWDDYFNSVKEDQEHTTAGRLVVLENSRKLFSEHLHFGDMVDENRKRIAGFGSEPDVDWGWFGSMRGHGLFMQAVNQNSTDISDALDQIPLTGLVSQEHFDEYVSRFQKSFDKSGIATATRLLAMKRPDYFVCLDSKNRDKLCEAFDIPKSVDLDDYWEKVIQRITDSNWWNAPEPKDDLEKRVWKCRAAFLDVRFYDPK